MAQHGWQIFSAVPRSPKYFGSIFSFKGAPDVRPTLHRRPSLGTWPLLKHVSERSRNRRQVVTKGAIVAMTVTLRVTVVRHPRIALHAQALLLR